MNDPGPGGETSTGIAAEAVAADRRGNCGDWTVVRSETSQAGVGDDGGMEDGSRGT